MNTVGDRLAIVISIVILMISLFRRSKWYKKWTQISINEALHKTSLTHGIGSSIDNDIKLEGNSLKFNHSSIVSNFKKRDETISLDELRTTLLQFKGFRKAAINNNNIIMSRCFELPEPQRRQLIEIDYFKKIQMVESKINESSFVINEIIKTTLATLFESNKDNNQDQEIIKLLCNELGFEIDPVSNVLSSMNNKNKMSRSNNNSRRTYEIEDYNDIPIMRINESLSHLCRDWSPSFKHELKPVLEYIESKLTLIPDIQLKRTLMVIPGCGAGYIPFYLSNKFPSLNIDSIEWSNFMYLCNQFVVNYTKDVQIAPFDQYYSNQLNSEDQTRLISVPLSSYQIDKKNTRLNSLWGDFRNYIPNNLSQIDNIIVVTVYFLDTAENVFQYLDTIELLKQYCQKDLHWINVGPLKYGTRPLVQFNTKELDHLRQIRGWEDIDVNIDNKMPNLNGYLTNTRSLYQGYYGLYKFHSKYK